jgi:hypothetical protein
MHELRVALGRAADALRGSFRNIEASASRLSIELAEKARRFEFDGGAAGAGEVNDYALDVEALQHPSGKLRFWSWYYLDQVSLGPSGMGADPAETKDVIRAIEDAMRPRFDERGRSLTRTAREMVGEIEKSLVEVAERVLAKPILGDARSDDPAERAGLTLDQAIALEAKYYALHTQNELLAERERKRTTPEDALRTLAPLSPSKLWGDDATKQYALRKLRSALAKAQPLTRVSPESRSTLKHADMLLVGMHPSLAASPLGSVVGDATEGLSAVPIGDWGDADRLVLYRSILGVPLYAFPHINEEMKANYLRYQAQPSKAWPLHIDQHWEALPDLDPEARRAELELRKKALRSSLSILALAIARGVVERTPSEHALIVGSSRLPLGRSPLDAATALARIETDKPSVHESAIAPLVAELAGGGGSGEIAASTGAWRQRCVELELLPSRDADAQREYEQLREATRALA